MVTSKLKGLIKKRQRALTASRMESDMYKHCRAKVKYECRVCKQAELLPRQVRSPERLSFARGKKSKESQDKKTLTGGFIR